MAGTRLGPYEIVAPFGAGGMGEVFRGRNTKLAREAALKILPASFAGDAGRRARFERGARTLAALNHPHIAQFYGFDESVPRAADGAAGSSAPWGPGETRLRAGDTRARCRAGGRANSHQRTARS